ncbi:MAG TPA: hypothetical protein DCE81_11570, partial [Cytophagales bacterium]|nr:hypothetical protein [Cytophagales bacterium]
SGNLGIGTATPAHRLDVAGTINATSVLVNGQPVSVAPSQWVNGTGNISYSAGDVGIGTSSPLGSRLHVDINRATTALSSVGYPDCGLLLRNTNTTANNLTVLNFADAAGWGVAGIAAQVKNHTSHTAALQFFTRNNGATPVANMVLDELGRLGIGTATPSEALEIGGTGYLKVGGGRISLDGVAGYYGNGIRYESSQVRIFQSGSLGAAFGGGITTLYGGGNAALTIDGNRNVGIGTASPTQKLTVNGIIYGREVKVDAAVPGPDYVFEKDYDLLSLEDLRSYIESNKHLPEVPSAKEMEANGLNLSEMNLLLLKKVEELTLHLLAMDERMKALQKQLDDRGQK